MKVSFMLSVIQGIYGYRSINSLLVQQLFVICCGLHMCNMLQLSSHTSTYTICCSYPLIPPHVQYVVVILSYLLMYNMLQLSSHTFTSTICCSYPLIPPHVQYVVVILSYLHMYNSSLKYSTPMSADMVILDLTLSTTTGVQPSLYPSYCSVYNHCSQTHI